MSNQTCQRRLANQSSLPRHGGGGGEKSSDTPSQTLARWGEAGIVQGILQPLGILLHLLEQKAAQFIAAAERDLSQPPVIQQ